MIRPLGLLAVFVLALALWNAALARARERERRETTRVGTLFSPEEAEELRKQPALRLELPGESYLYARVQGEWRCLSYHEAPADARAVQGLLDTLARAEGIVHTSSTDEAPAYGINAPGTIRIAILGPRALEDPTGEQRAAFDVGASVPGRGQCFVRKKGTKEVWAIDGDPRAALESRVAPGLPPLLEPSCVPGAWLAAAGGITSLAVAPATGGRYTLERQERMLPPEELSAGKPPWTWILEPGAEERELALEPASSFAAFVERASYLEVLPAERRAELVPEPAAATLTLCGRESEPLRLAFGPPDPDGRVPLWVERSRALYLVAPESFALLVPESARLLEGAPGEEAQAEAHDNPWSAALRSGGPSR